MRESFGVFPASPDRLPYRDQSCVYLLYGEGEDLLYVGCSKHARDRLATHAKDKRFVEARRYELEIFDGYNEARKREKVLIRTLNPRINSRRYVTKVA
jgi:predicted GIY-YIG superfamily endonuclease